MYIHIYVYLYIYIYMFCATQLNLARLFYHYLTLLAPSIKKRRPEIYGYRLLELIIKAYMHLIKIMIIYV